MFDILYGFVVPVHADVCQQSDIAEQVVELVFVSSEELGECAGIFSSKYNFDDFASIFVVALIRNIFKL